MTVNLKTCEYSIPKTIFGKTGGQSSWSTYMTDNNGQSYGYMNYVMLRGIPGKVLEVTGITVEGNNVIAELSRSSMPMYWANQWSGSWGGYEHSVNNVKIIKKKDGYGRYSIASFYYILPHKFQQEFYEVIYNKN